MIVAGSESFDPKLSSATLDGLKVIELAQIDPKLSSAALNCLKVIDLAQIVGLLVSTVCPEHWRLDFVAVTKLQFLMLLTPNSLYLKLAKGILIYFFLSDLTTHSCLRLLRSITTTYMYTVYNNKTTTTVYLSRFGKWCYDVNGPFTFVSGPIVGPQYHKVSSISHSTFFKIIFLHLTCSDIEKKWEEEKKKNIRRFEQFLCFWLIGP